MITDKDIRRIRSLAREIYEEAHSTRQQERINRYKSINALRPERPPVAIYPPPQAMADLVPDASLKVADPVLREQERVLSLNNGGQLIGSCSYPFTDELPGPDYSGGPVSPRHLWAFSHAQEFTGVSPDIYRQAAEVLRCAVENYRQP